MLGFADKVTGHAGKNESVEGSHGPPVGMPGESTRMEDGALNQPRSPVGQGLNGEFQPRQTGHAHLGTQPQQPWGVSLLHAPEVHRITHEEEVGMTATAAQAHPTHQTIEESANLP